ncbi:MAG: antitoxin Xre-like helix-turn-helix domain-containing protein [Halomonas sp.]|nr:antitoxin Xre-like helix-turn-helix domain-containing protein [Halomonas sp.]
MSLTEAPASSKAKAAAGLKAAVTILEKWSASNEQGTAILRVSRSTYARAKRGDPDWEVNLDSDQLTRISLVLNIHAALRVIFDNPENLYGFMAMANHNAYFHGKSPLELIGQGGILTLYEVFKRIDSLRGAQW